MGGRQKKSGRMRQLVPVRSCSTNNLLMYRKDQISVHLPFVFVHCRAVWMFEYVLAGIPAAAAAKTPKHSRLACTHPHILVQIISQHRDEIVVTLEEFMWTSKKKRMAKTE